MDTKDIEVVLGLLFEENYGPNDELLNQQNGKAYWISSMRYSGTGWQTAVFDRTRFLWLSRPIFRVNEMENPVRALENHFIAILVVAEFPPESWPKGMSWTEPTDASWSEARAKAWKGMNELGPLYRSSLKGDSGGSFVEFARERMLETMKPHFAYYSTLRSRTNVFVRFLVKSDGRGKTRGTREASCQDYARESQF